MVNDSAHTTGHPCTKRHNPADRIQCEKRKTEINGKTLQIHGRYRSRYRSRFFSLSVMVGQEPNRLVMVLSIPLLSTENNPSILERIRRQRSTNYDIQNRSSLSPPSPPNTTLKSTQILCLKKKTVHHSTL